MASISRKLEVTASQLFGIVIFCKQTLSITGKGKVYTFILAASHGLGYLYFIMLYHAANQDWGLGPSSLILISIA
jgi:hypothetical protein